MDSRQKRTRTKANASSTTTAPVRRSTRVASRTGWRIPAEILLLIMSELRNFSGALRASALVCRAWRSPAQLYLFSRLRIESHEDCKRITSILRKSPHIASQVHRLAVFEFDERGSLPAYSFVTPSTFNKFLNLKSLYLESRLAIEIASKLGSTVRELSIAVFPFRKNTPNIFKSLPRVQVLRVDDCEDIPVESLMEIIRNMSELTSLHLFCGSLEPSQSEYERGLLSLDDLQQLGGNTAGGSGADTHPVRLTRLTLDRIDHRFAFMKFLLDKSYFDLDALGELNLVWMKAGDQRHLSRLDFRYLDRLLDRVGPSLKCLKLGLYGGVNCPSDHYIEHLTANSTASPFQHLTTLENFSIECKEHSSHGLDPSPHLALLACLSPSALSRVRLGVTVDVEEFPETDEKYFVQPEEIPSRHWKALDSLLGDESRFPTFQSLTINVTLEFRSSMTLISLDDIDPCENPSCTACARAAALVRREKELLAKHKDESVDETARQIVGLFKEAMPTLEGRGSITIVVCKQNRSVVEYKMSDFENWDD
ncbi:hypothetical protein VKT23_019158 [Stygiomarasmius scandens]|uniref:F-box domain-containing protein n=1 Tax=Marasmiellus scandens TaxID=2682957 RepID=A0ABR1IME0_9AGAR